MILKVGVPSKEETSVKVDDDTPAVLTSKLVAEDDENGVIDGEE